MPMQSLDPAIAKRVQAWLDGPYDPETKAEIKRLLAKDPKSLTDAFFKDISFGTGGMRGIMGVGTNRMNLYTLRKATQGLANYLKKQPEKPSGYAVFIGYDVRHHSRQFAEEAARVLVGNGMRAFLAKEVCPTPLVSFGCRYYECSAGIMITASHNPPQYNGFKVYWSDGGQVVPPHDEGIMQEVEQVQSLDAISIAEEPIQEVGEELDKIYLRELKQHQFISNLDSIKIIYTNLHGTGIRLVPKALQEWGYRDVALVEKQAPLDPNFSSAPTPNPEEQKALQLGIGQMLREKADLLLATDPDADRVGAVIREKERAISLTGNQIGCICLHHICEQLTQKQAFPENAAFIKTIVTTELFRKIAESYGGACIDVLTGFKYIGEKIGEWEASFGGYQFLFGAEESYGYLFGTFVRDKDAISSCCLIAEAAALAKKQNLTLHDRLYTLYKKYGIHREKLLNLSFHDGLTGMQEMQSLMKRLRDNPPFEIDKIPVLRIEDYLDRTLLDLQTGERTSLVLPQSDVLRFWLKDKSKLVIRPSGTEPKVKIYAEVVEEEPSDLEQSVVACDERLEKLLSLFQKALQL